MGTLRAIFTINISALSEAALRAKLAGYIARLRREYAQKQLTQEFLKKQRENNILDYYDNLFYEDEREQVRYLDYQDRRRIDRRQETLDLALSIENYRKRDLLYSGFWVRIEDAPENSHAKFAFTPPGAFGWRVLEYSDIYSALDTQWEYDYGGNLNAHLTSTFGTGIDSFTAMEDIPRFNYKRGYSPWNLVPRH